MPKFPPRPESPAGGPGWGGPAKGASASRFAPGQSGGGHTADNRALAAARREKVLNLYEAIVDDEDQPAMVRITAGDKLLDRTEGKPPQTNINLNSHVPADELSDDELARIAAGSGSDAADPEGDPPLAH